MIRHRLWLLIAFLFFLIIAGVFEAKAQTGIVPSQVRLSANPFAGLIEPARANIVIGNDFYRVRFGPEFVFALENGEVVLRVAVQTPAAPKPVFETLSIPSAPAPRSTLSLSTAGIDPKTIRYFRNGILQTENVDFSFDVNTGGITLAAGATIQTGDTVTVFWLKP